MTLRKRRRARASEVRRVLRMIDRLEVPFGDADRARHEVLIVRLEEALRRARDPDAARRLEEARRLPERKMQAVHERGRRLAAQIRQKEAREAAESAAFWADYTSGFEPADLDLLPAETDYVEGALRIRG